MDLQAFQCCECIHQLLLRLHAIDTITIPPATCENLVVFLFVSSLHSTHATRVTPRFIFFISPACLPQSFSLGVYEVPGYYSRGPGALDITEADALQKGLLIQLLPQILAMRTFPPLPCEQLTKGFFDAPDPMHDVAICFVKVRACV